MPTTKLPSAPDPDAMAYGVDAYLSALGIPVEALRSDPPPCLLEEMTYDVRSRPSPE